MILKNKKNKGFLNFNYLIKNKLVFNNGLTIS